MPEGYQGARGPPPVATARLRLPPPAPQRQAEAGPAASARQSAAQEGRRQAGGQEEVMRHCGRGVCVCAPCRAPPQPALAICCLNLKGQRSARPVIVRTSGPDSCARQLGFKAGRTEGQSGKQCGTRETQAQAGIATIQVVSRQSSNKCLDGAHGKGFYRISASGLCDSACGASTGRNETAAHACGTAKRCLQYINVHGLIQPGR